MPDANHLFLYSIMIVCCAIESVLTLSDHKIFFQPYLRPEVYFNGAFWPGLLDNWKPNYAAQPYTMFVSHGFLHTGWIHLVVNMITLVSLGLAVIRRVGQGAFILFYGISALGGGLGFALLADNLQPMVGASGALFGLLGALLAWELKDSWTDREALKDYFKIVLLLSGLNLLYWGAMDGQLAWQAHLGGFVFGWITALFIGQKPFDIER